MKVPIFQLTYCTYYVEAMETYLKQKNAVLVLFGQEKTRKSSDVQCPLLAAMPTFLNPTTEICTHFKLS